ncbi:MFS transporter [Streptacidiphilus jiangxiensis]|uniref:Transmembrane secretion effector n=1 Tax=Streptacidiphilus jiangxiensis TaxID=235985 RepID=A0A1H7XLY0_STRJI|nr:MFS transporter [Streptacidiphilus jiangxiensis]SEM34695.1 Transmembrane secretion effector [Streptacidiphilus jiangxiensis]
MLTALRSDRTASRSEPLGPVFRLYQSAVVTSDLGDGMYRIAVPLITLGITHSALSVSLVGFAVRLPWLVATLPAGVVNDRATPVRVMRAASLLRLVLLAAMCALAFLGELPLWLLALIAFGIGCAGTFVDVGAQSALPRLVRPEQLPKANATVQSAQTLLAQLLGPALGGVVVALGSGQGLATVAVLYAVTVVALGRIPSAPAAAPPASPPAGAASLRRDASLKSLTGELAEGLRYLGGRPDLRRLALAGAANNLSYSISLTLLPLWAVAPGPLRLPQISYGLLLACLAVGSVIAGPFAGRTIDRLGQGHVMRYGGFGLGASYLMLAVPSVPVVAAGLLGYGLVCIVWNVAVVSYRQTTVPSELFGRVNAGYRWITWGVFPIGSLLAGALAEGVGLAGAFLVAGALPLLAAVFLPVRGLVESTA